MASSHRIINWLEEHPELREHVKNQKDRANCWAIVVARAIGARHTIHKRVKALRWLLSAQYLMDNFWHDRSSDIQIGTNGREARDPYGNYPLNAQYALEYVTQKGMPYEEDYPYTGSFDHNEPIKDTSKLNKVYISSFSFLGCTSDGEATKEAIYQALLNGGPLIGTVEPTRSFIDLKGGILRPEDDSVSSYNPSNGDSTSEGEADEAEEEADEAEEEGDEAEEEGDEAEEEGDEAEEEGDKADEEGDEAGSPKSQSHNIDNVGTGADILESESHNSDDPGIISHLILVVGMDFEQNTFLVQNSLGRKWGIDGVGTMDCELVYDILDIDINDDRNRGFVGPTSSSSHKQQRELKLLGRRTISGQCLPQKTPERDFRIRISGLEIYNENVKDLLNSDSGRNAKLLDDPEKGTVVEKLVEETANDDQHLKSLIRIFEAQRQVGETAPNDTSSRSHQIMRLTIESTLCENSNCVRSYVARLNFVDLAGSERASQTNPDGVRLREGCHINLSLMTLTTVIRKLSVGKRSGHIPYRDSKLTLILQHSLGDNARTAIICTLSPVSGHVEQSRNTLFFATGAKEVTNNAQVNMVISDKQLIKHLQKEVARLEAARTPDPLSEKDYKIQQMEKEIEELRIQRDLAQSQVDELRRKLQEPQVLQPTESRSPNVKKCLSFPGALSPNLMGKEPGYPEKTKNTMARQTMRQSSTAPFTLMHVIKKLEQLQEQLGEEANRPLEVLQNEVACHRQGNQDAAETIAELQAEIRDMCAVRPAPKEVEVESVVSLNKSISANLKDEITRLHTQGSNIAELEEQLENVQKSIDKLVMSLPRNADQQCKAETSLKTKNHSTKKRLLPLASSNTGNRQNFIRFPCSPLSSTRQVFDSETENRTLECEVSCSNETPLVSGKDAPLKSEDGGDVSLKEGTPNRRTSSVNMKKMQKMFQNAAEENVRSIGQYETELKERVAKLQYQKQLLVCQVLELEANEAAGYDWENENMPEIQESPISWTVTFREQRQEIIEIYLEVELKRLNWLQQHLAEIGNTTPAHTGDEPTITVSSRFS